MLQSASEGGGGVADSNERAITGTIKYIHMERDNVIASADVKRYDREILKNSDFQFSDNGDGGFMVQLVYNEPSAMPGEQNQIDNAVLESFEISREILSEMRRNYAFQTTIIFGMLQFRVTELVRQMNNIVSMNDIFSSLSFDERGFKLKKDQTKETKLSKKSNTPNVVVADDQSDEEKPKTADSADKKSKKSSGKGDKDAKPGKDAKVGKGKGGKK